MDMFEMTNLISSSIDKFPGRFDLCCCASFFSQNITTLININTDSSFDSGVVKMNIYPQTMCRTK